MYDIIIIGGGVIGSCLAYELSRYQLSVLLLEKENDVSLGASRANTAIIHGGYDPEPGTLMAETNVRGARLCMERAETLDIEFQKTGSLLVAFDADDEKTLQRQYIKGLRNGVQGLEIWPGERAREREPRLSTQIRAALWIPESGVINPWELTLAHAEVAVREGVELRLQQEVQAIEATWRGYRVHSQDTCYEARYVVNAAGLGAEKIHNMVAAPAFHLEPTRGQYYLLDRSVGEIVRTVIFPCPTSRGKGILVSPTVHGNILLGPDAERVADADDTATTAAGLARVAEEARRSVPDLDIRANIRNYAGVRPNSDYGDFFVRFAAPHFLDMAAIKSPGLTSAPALAQDAVRLLMEDGLQAERKAPEAWNGRRRVVRFKDIPEAERAAFVARNPDYGRVICRCETITEGEILAAFRRGLPVLSVDAVKRRTGSGMGRCQGGFCGPRILEILARENHVPPEVVTQDRVGSYILTGPLPGAGRAADDACRRLCGESDCRAWRPAAAETAVSAPHSQQPRQDCRAQQGKGRAEHV